MPINIQNETINIKAICVGRTINVSLKYQIIYIIMGVSILGT